MKKLFVLAYSLLFVSCGGTRKTIQAIVIEPSNYVDQSTEVLGPVNIAESNFFFEGDFKYFADAATLKDCATGDDLPVAQLGIFQDIKSSYMNINSKTQEGIFASFRGFLHKNEGEGKPYLLVITYFNGWNLDVSCNPQLVIAGNYKYTMHGKDNVRNEISLSLNRDYSFETKAYNTTTKKMEIETKGSWSRLSKNKISFLFESNSAHFFSYSGTIDFTNMTLSMVNGKGENLIFKKEK